MAAGIYNFTIEQGATFTRTFKYKQSDGTPFDLTEYSARMDIRTSIGGDLLASTSTGTITLTVGGTNGEIDLTITPSVSSTFTFDTAVYDLEIFTSGNTIVNRLLSGKIKLSKEITTSTT